MSSEKFKADTETPDGTRRKGLRSRLDNLSTFESLRIRDYRLLWFGQVSTSMGQWMDQVSRGWLIYAITGSPLQLGMATAVRGLPLLFFGIIAGAMADRSGRKQQLIVAQATNALLNIILATLVLTRHIQPWHIYVTGFLAGTVQAFQQPARQTLIGDIVGGRNLMNALALNSAALNGSRTIGPALAGILIAIIGVHGSYYTQAGLYAFATVWTAQMRVPDRSNERMRQARLPFFASIKEGLTYSLAHPNIRTLLLLGLVPLVLAMPYTSLMPIFAKDVLHGGARLQGLLLSCVGVGSLAGALIVASIRREYGYGWTVAVGAAAFGLALVGFSLSPWVLLSGAMAAVVGIFSVAYRTQNQTLLQLLPPRHLRGRVLSVFLTDRGLVPIGTVLAGVLASAFGGPKALMILSGASVVSVGLILLIYPPLLRLKVPLQEETASDSPRSGLS